MPTFLPFRRAVKALAERRAVWALISVLASSACAGRVVNHLAQGPSTGPSASASTAASPQPAPDADKSSVAAPEPKPATGALDATSQLAFEEPYPLDARPRAASALQAAADDEELARWNLGGTADPNYPSSQASFHPGTRVVVDAELAGRHGTRQRARGPVRGLSAERVQAQTRSQGYWPFRLCFEAGQRENKGVGGETRILFTIGTRGNVSAARLLSSELHHRASSACLLAELRKLRFTPRPQRSLDIVTSIRLWPGDAELPPVSAAPAPLVDTTRGFDPATVRAIATRKQPELSACFSEARRNDPSLWGRLALAVVLEVDGTVHRVSEVESHFPNSAAAHCAAATLSNVVFASVNGKPFSFVLALRVPPLSTTPGVAASGNADLSDVPEPQAPPNSGDAGAGDSLLVP